MTSERAGTRRIVGLVRFLSLSVVLAGVAMCGFGVYFAGIGILEPSEDNATINYFMLAVPLLALGLGIVLVGGRALRDKNRPSR